MSRFILLLTFFLTFVTAAALDDGFRTFTSRDGKQLEAKLENYEPLTGRVIIRNKDNRTFTIHYRMFSKEDQEYLTAWREEYDRSNVVLEFMGLKVEASRIVFLIDASKGKDGDGKKKGKKKKDDKGDGLATERWDRIQFSISQVINELPDGVDFNVATYGGDTSAFSEQLVPSTEDNRKNVVEWFQGISPSGGTDMTKGFEKALSNQNVEAIVLISHGEPDDEGKGVYQLLNAHNQNRERKVRVYTVSYRTEKGISLLKDLADTYNGKFVRR